MQSIKITSRPPREKGGTSSASSNRDIYESNTYRKYLSWLHLFPYLETCLLHLWHLKAKSVGGSVPSLTKAFAAVTF